MFLILDCNGCWNVREPAIDGRARAKNRMKHCALAALVAAFIVVVTAPAQVIQVAPATEGV
jgi:hypothetical protein